MDTLVLHGVQVHFRHRKELPLCIWIQIFYYRNHTEVSIYCYYTYSEGVSAVRLLVRVIVLLCAHMHT